MQGRGQINQLFRKGVGWSVAGTLGAIVLQMLQMIVFARWAGPEAMGLYALVASVTAFLMPFAEAGLGQAVVQAKVVDGHQVAALGWLNFGIGLLLFVCCAVGGTAVTGWMGHPEAGPLLGFMAITLLFTPFGAQYGGLLVRNMRFDLAARIEWVSGILGFMAMLAGLYFYHNAWALVWGYVAKTSLACIGAWWYGRHIVEVQWFRPASLRSAGRLIRLGLLDLSARWADVGVNYLDKLFIGKWLGATALGYYNLAFGLYLIPVNRLAGMVTRVAFPATARLQDDAAGVQAFFEKTSAQLIALLFPVFMGMGLFAEEIIVLLYGNTWLPAVPMLQVLAVAGLVRTLATLIPQVMRGLGQPQEQLYMLLLWILALNSFLGFFLWIWPDLWAVVWSRLWAKIFVETGLLYYFASRCGIQFGRVFRLAVLAGSALGAVALLAYWAADSLGQKLWIVIAGWGILLWLNRKKFMREII